MPSANPGMKPKFNPWPYGVVFVFVLLISGMATAVAIALTHREALVSDSYYEEELRYQTQIDGAARARQEGATVLFDATSRQVVVRIPSVQASQGCSGTIQFYRPSAPELDRSMQFEPMSNGSQSVDVSRFAVGLWRVRVAWKAGGLDYYLEQRISIPSK